MAAEPWNNRIVGHADVDPVALAAHPRNYRAHPDQQTAALLGAIHDVGFTRSVTVNQRSGFLIDGHLRVALAIRERQPTIPVEYVDLSPAEELEALLTTDPLAAMAAIEAESLASLLADVQSGEAAVQAMLSELAEAKGIIPTDGHMDSLANLAGIAPKDCEQLTFVVHLGKAETIRARVKAIADDNPAADLVAPMTWALDALLDAYDSDSG